jgi:hypothetical protein
VFHAESENPWLTTTAKPWSPSPSAHAIDSSLKAVFSMTLRSVQRKDGQLVLTGKATGVSTAVRVLKPSDHFELAVLGGEQIARPLTRLGLIDEY